MEPRERVVEKELSSLTMLQTEPGSVTGLIRVESRDTAESSAPSGIVGDDSESMDDNN